MDDLEELKKELEETRLAYQMAMRINQLKTGFLARTAHEIRSPLSSLMGLHQLILSDLCESPQEEREFIVQAHQVVQRLIKIIDEIVLVSKLEYGKIPLNQEILNLQEIIETTLTLTHLQARNANLKLTSTNSQESIYIRGDKERLICSLVNLIDTLINRLEQGIIEIKVGQENQRVIINIFAPCEKSIWEDSQHLLEQHPPQTLEAAKKFAQELEMSTGEKYLLSLHLITAMGGHLSVVELNDNPSITQLQILFPPIVSAPLAPN